MPSAHSESYLMFSILNLKVINFNPDLHMGKVVLIRYCKPELPAVILIAYFWLVSFQRWNKEILLRPALEEIYNRQRQQQPRKMQHCYHVLLWDVCSLVPQRKMAFVMIAITRRATSSKLHQQLLELMNNRVQTRGGTSIILTLLQKIIHSATALMDYKVLSKSPRFIVHHASLARVVRAQVREMVLSMVRDAVEPTAPCLEHLRQMATVPGAFWKAQYLCHTLIQFQVMFSVLCTKCSLDIKETSQLTGWCNY